MNTAMPGTSENSPRGIRTLIIPGIYFPGIGFSFDHCHDFRLTVDGVLMTLPNLKTYFSNGRSFGNTKVKSADPLADVFQQIYFSGIYLYNLLMQKGFDAEILNCYTSGRKDSENKIRENFDVVLISTTFTWCPQIKPLLRELKKANPGAKIIIGGRWVYDSYRIWERCKELQLEEGSSEVLVRYFFTGSYSWKDVDVFIVDQHGENTLIKVLSDIQKGANFRDNPNCAYWNDNGEIVFTETMSEQYDVENLTIDWSKLPEKYHSSVMPLAAGIGCPFRCKFCDYNVSKLYHKPFDLLRKELRQMNECRFLQTAWFIDDNFLFNTKRIREFCDMWLEESFRLSWYGIVRLDSLQDSTVALMRKTGLRMVMLGVESGSPKILANMNKKVAIDQYKRGFELLAAHGIRAKILLVIGFPGENDETISETIDFINSLPGTPEIGHEIFLSPFCLLPLASVASAAERAKYNLRGFLFDWSHNTMRAADTYGAMKRIFLETRGVFQYYPDNNRFESESPEARSRFTQVAVAREELARAIVGGRSKQETALLWGNLETLVMKR